jgi:enoyl-CoA hydratase
MTDEVLIQRHDGVLTVTLNRPGQRNAMTLDAAKILAEAMDELDGTPELRVGVLTGAGGVFCAGMDLKAFRRGERPALPGRGFGGLTERPPQKPLIAAVEGWALGGGFELVLACDLVVAGRGAKFGLPEVKRGLAARGGGLLRLPVRLPRNIALELVMTGQPLEAGRARELGLVNRVVDDGMALTGALALAKQIEENAPLAVTVSKQVIVEAPGWPLREGFDRQKQYLEPVFASDDAREGAAAFAERRSPVWRGH